MNSSILWLNASSFASEDMNYFLKNWMIWMNWMIGGNSNLSHLVLELSTEIEEDAIFNMLLIEQRDEEMEFELAGSVKVVYNSSYELKRQKDGATALILSKDKAQSEFRMIVWNPVQDEEQ